MNPFSATSRAAGRGLALLAALFLLVPGGAATAQKSPGEDLRGVWQIEVPGEGPVILIVKKNNRASWFRGEGPDRTVYQGSWTEAGDGLDLSWEAGGQLLMRPNRPTVDVIALDAAGNERFRSVALLVPDEVLGQWARPPRSEDDLLADRDEAEGFFGLWETGDEEVREHLFVEPDRSAASTWAGGAAGDRGLRGSWARQGSELHIAWDTGHYSIIRETPRGYTYVRLEPGTEIEEAEAPPVPARRLREADIDPAWMARYEEERAAENSGLAFSSRRNAQRFYRGDWLVQRGPNDFERIGVGRFGGLDTSRSRDLDGEWRLSGQDLFMLWSDGTRRIISPVGNGFVLYEYRAGRPLDGIPTRIHATVPAEAKKLEEHLADRAEVARQLHDLAEASGVEEPAREAGWGRTFMRWAWPFGGAEESPETAEELLEEEFAPSDRNDPWWWPFWSETTPQSEGSDQSDQSDQSDESDRSDPSDKNPGKWLWPY